MTIKLDYIINRYWYWRKSEHPSSITEYDSTPIRKGEDPQIRYIETRRNLAWYWESDVQYFHKVLLKSLLFNLSHYSVISIFHRSFEKIRTTFLVKFIPDFYLLISSFALAWSSSTVACVSRLLIKVLKVLDSQTKNLKYIWTPNQRPMKRTYPTGNIFTQK